MDLIIFDLDGTLVDSRQDIATSVNELLTRLGRPGLPSEQVFDFIGNGVRKLIERSLGGATAPEELDEAVQLYLQIYGRRLLDCEALARSQEVYVPSSYSSARCISKGPCAELGERTVSDAVFGFGDLFDTICCN